MQKFRIITTRMLFLVLFLSGGFAFSVPASASEASVAVSNVRKPLFNVLFGVKTQVHKKSLSLRFFDEILKGKGLDPAIYLQRLVNEKHYYSCLENRLKSIAKSTRRKKDKDLTGLIMPEVFRTKQLEKDIVFFMTHFDLARPEPSSEAQGIASTIAAYSRRDIRIPVYYLYVGLLSGQIIRNKLVAFLENELPGVDSFGGVNFYKFYQNGKELSTREMRALEERYIKVFEGKPLSWQEHARYEAEGQRFTSLLTKSYETLYWQPYLKARLMRPAAVTAAAFAITLLTIW